MPYVILSNGVDYNDETHYIGGDESTVDKVGYNDVKTARDVVRGLLKADLRHYSLYDFENQNETALSRMSDWMGIPKEESVYGFGNYRRTYYSYPWELKEYSWTNYIDECEKREVEWVDSVPELYQIIEVTFS